MDKATVKALEAVADEAPAMKQEPYAPKVDTPEPDPAPLYRPRTLMDQTSGAYGELYRILHLAFEQSATGKGRERHAHSCVGFKAWDKQPILEISRMVGPGYASGQVAKKVQEAVTMAGNRNFTGAKAEALGAVVYAAALYKLFEEMEQA